MATQCKGCGNFIQDKITACPVCGKTIPAEPDTVRHPRMAPQGLFQESWDNFRANRAELFALSPVEATVFKVAIGVMIAIFVSILFANR